ncbi:hypothetical protein DM806_04050 [Sphingobium lactosutens]|uniref:alcohol dehydrogenase catalytic domain-containing protein n=1 Tax=Sphingobium lactosutens TaxID=522773 RepID=UPI0015C136E6|nr:alcohol dehydrogenase catalytic domain-containing protein [Sphingobium lactosutens]NWK94851.1 hypothetical protein [Sphingobium lactosutens]
MTKILTYGTRHSFTGLKPIEIDRQSAGAGEVEIEIIYCGVCHSDVHQAENDWSNTVYPCVPGHEILGRVSAVGEGVTKFAIGDLVGVGCMIDSCGHCRSCREGEENYCESPNGPLGTYNGPAKPATVAGGQNIYGRDNTVGGYSTSITVKESFVLKVPDTLPIERAAPILCAGITTYSPLKHWGAGPGKRVGVVGRGRRRAATRAGGLRVQLRSSGRSDVGVGRRPGSCFGSRGRYCEDCHVADVIEGGGLLRGGVRPYAIGPRRAEALWAKSEEMVGERF